MLRRALLSLPFLLLCAGAAAQTGIVDQSAPFGPAGLGAGSSALQLQQEVHVGVGGRLDGIRCQFGGVAGGSCELRVREGEAWNTGPIAWSATFVKAASPSVENVYFDVSPAGVVLAAGDVFVIELVGLDTGILSVGGSQVQTYPGELYLNGAATGSNLGFWTYMLPPELDGLQDQAAPFDAATLNAGEESLAWQQQVRAGVTGTLRLFELVFSGDAGASARITLRRGDGWSAGPALWSQDYVHGGGFTAVLFDPSGAAIGLAAGETFVVEVDGLGTGVLAAAAQADDPVYPEPLYLNGASDCFAGCQIKLAFRTWMDTPTLTLRCAPAHANSTGQPVTLADSSFSGPGVLHLEATGGPAGEFGMFLVSLGLNEPGTPLGAGRLCLAAPIGRYSPQAGGTRNSIGIFGVDGRHYSLAGNSTVGSGFDVRPLLPNPPGGTITAGTSYYFQCWYRDGQSSNLSDVIGFAP